VCRGIRYTDEFKQEAVNQVVNHGHCVLDVTKRLGISSKSLYDWMKIFGKPQHKREEEADLRTICSNNAFNSLRALKPACRWFDSVRGY
jgi:transposase-like protein